MFSILLVEDDQVIADLVKFILKDTGKITHATNGMIALDIVESNPDFDLIISDIVMPTMDGYELLSALDDLPQKYPVVMLTALAGDKEQLIAYEHRIEDYITKPFTALLFKKKIETILRRLYPSAGSSQLFVFNDDEKQLYVLDVSLQLTATEYDLLHFLQLNNGRFFNKEDLLERFWDEDIYDPRVVDQRIKRIRSKLGDNAYVIETKYKVGYRYNEHKD